jgi:hypothetical protein
VVRVALGRALRIAIEIRHRATQYVYTSGSYFPLSPRVLTSLACIATAGAQKAIDVSSPPSGPIADAVKRSSRAHVFYFYTLMCEIASVPRKRPNSWIADDRLVATKYEKQENGGMLSAHVASGVGPGVDHGRVLLFDARVLAREYLKEVGRELPPLRAVRW